MKRLQFLAALVGVMLVMASCTTSQRVAGGEFDEMEGARRVGDRVYVDDPYYGTVVLERDPFTGRYFDVTNGYYGRSRYGYNPYGFGVRPYGRVYGGRAPRSYGNYSQPRPSQEQAPKPSREEARKRILGN